MSSLKVQMLGGYLEITPDAQNEMSLVSTIDDPPALRLASPGGGLGKLSGNVLDHGVQREVVLLQFKNDEADRGTPLERKGGCVTLHLQNPNIEGDAGMVKVFEMTTRGVTFFVPVIGFQDATREDAFGMQVREWYRVLLHRQAAVSEVDGARGNPGGLPGVLANILASPEYAALHP